MIFIYFFLGDSKLTGMITFASFMIIINIACIIYELYFKFTYTTYLSIERRCYFYTYYFIFRIVLFIFASIEMIGFFMICYYIKDFNTKSFTVDIIKKYGEPLEKNNGWVKTITPF